MSAPFSLYRHQFGAIDMLRGAVASGSRRVLLHLPTGGGKCLGLGTPVLRYDGRIVLVESIMPGDVLMGPDSLPRVVTSTTRGMGPLFRIVPTRGASWSCNDVHVLTLVESGTGRIVDIPLNEYARKSATFRGLHKQFSPEDGIEFAAQDSLSIDPYFLGVWLGDGTKKLATVDVSKPDAEIKAACLEVANEWGCTVTERASNGRCPTYSIVTPRGKPNPLLVALRRIFGPDGDYSAIRTASILERQQFLAGIIDTDGYCRNGSVEIAQKRVDHADLITFVARSLGFRVLMSTKTVNGDTYSRLSISGNFGPIPMRIPRKKIGPRQQRKIATRTGFTIEPIGPGAYCGFELTGDGRFLLGDFTVTHNTVVAADIFRTARQKGTRCCFVVPMISLIDQTVDRLQSHGLTDIGVMQADHPLTDPSKPIQVATLQTLARREKPDVGLVIVDEAHRQDRELQKWLGSPAMSGSIVVGLSATPWAKGMSKHWNQLVVCSTTKEMIATGFLSPYRVFAPSHPDLSGVKTRGGDFVEADLSKAMDKPQLVADVVETWLRLGENRPTLVFAVDRAHAKSLQDQFEVCGVPCGYIDCYSTPEDRKSVERKFASGEYPVVCSVATLTTGVDWDVRCIVLARPTKSEILYCQIIGRGLRPVYASWFDRTSEDEALRVRAIAEGPKPECLILDHSDNTLRLGFVDDIHHDELSDGSPRTSSGERNKPLPKECPNCSVLKPAKVSKCPHCGHRPEMTTDVETTEGYLAEVGRRFPGTLGVPDGMVQVGGNVMDRRKFYLMLAHIGRERGYKEGWASNKYRDMTKAFPPFSWRDEMPIRPDLAVKQWVKSRDIAHAYRRPGGGDRARSA